MLGLRGHCTIFNFLYKSKNSCKVYQEKGQLETNQQNLWDRMAQNKELKCRNIPHIYDHLIYVVTVQSTVERTVINKWCCINCIALCLTTTTKNHFYLYFSLYAKIYPSGMKDLNMKTKTILFLKDEIGDYLHDLRAGKDFLNRIQKALTTFKNYDLHCTKIKIFCLSQFTIKRVKGQVTEWDEIFALHIMGNRLTFRTYKQLL